MQLVANRVPLWKQVLRQNFTHLSKLANFLELSSEQQEQLLFRPRFVLNLPYRLAEKIEKKTLEDPILQQFVPRREEENNVLGFITDPVGEKHCRKSKKLLHKYPGRVLLVCTSVCAMHCRFCFRQHFEYEHAERSFDEEIGIIAADDSIQEVILSGGGSAIFRRWCIKNVVQKIG